MLLNKEEHADKTLRVAHVNLYRFSYAMIILIFGVLAGILAAVCYYPKEAKEGGPLIMAILGFLGSSLKKICYKFFGKDKEPDRVK